MSDSIFRDTIIDIYPAYLKKEILKQSVEEGLIINNRKASNQICLNLTDNVDVTNMITLDEKIERVLQEENICAFVEEFEYKKIYRHFCYFGFDEIDIKKIEDLVKDNKVNVFDKKEHKAVDTYEKPTIYIVGECIYLKFLQRLNNDTGKEIRYIILVIIDKENKILELRFDRVGIAYKNSYFFYRDKINSIIEYLHDNLNLDIYHIDFKAVIDYIKTEKEDVTIYAQRMNRNGTTAYLEAYGDGESLMPILGELNGLIDSNSELFEVDSNTRLIRSKLLEFMQEIEVKSDMPMVKVRMDNENIKFGITHNYKGTDYSLFMYYGELIGDKEMMSNVKRYLIQCYRELNNEVSVNTLSAEKM